MSSSRTAPAARLVVVVLVAVVAMLVAPLAGVTSGAPAPVASGSGSQAQAGSAPAEAVVASSARKAKKATRVKKAKKTKKAKGRKAGARAAQAGVARPPAGGARPAVAWSGSSVTYYDGLPASWRWSLETAVSNWNRAGESISLVPVSDPGQAQVKISYGRIDSSGLATVGQTSGAFVQLSDQYAQVDARDPYYKVEVMGVLTHELGHVLGLEHAQTSCQLMGPVMDIVGCGIYDMNQPQAYRCEVVGDAAADQAVNMYGGSPRRQAGSCPVPA